MDNNMWYTVFKVSLPSSSIAFILATVLTALLCWLYLNKKTADVFLNYAITFIVTWKFSYIVTDWQGFIDYPLSVFYFDGGKVGFAIALAVVIGYAVWDRLKGKESTVNQITYFILTYASYHFFFVLLNNESLTVVISWLVLAIGSAAIIIALNRSNNHKIYFVSITIAVVYMIFSLVVEPLGWQQMKLVAIIGFLMYTIFNWKWSANK